MIQPLDINFNDNDIEINQHFLNNFSSRRENEYNNNKKILHLLISIFFLLCIVYIVYKNESIYRGLKDIEKIM